MAPDGGTHEVKMPPISREKPREKSTLVVGPRGVQLRTFDDLWRFAVAAHQSGLVPKSLNSAEKCLIALQAGMEAGLSPMRALQSVYVVNGAPAWKGEAALALIRASGLLRPGSTITMRYEGEGDNHGAYIATWRAGDAAPQQTGFTVAQAKKAKLWGKSGPWSEYPDRMLRWRAVGHHASDYWSDVLAGLHIAEVVQDAPADAQIERDVTPPSTPDPLLAAVTPDPVVAAAAEIMGGQGVPDPLDERTDAEKQQSDPRWDSEHNMPKAGEGIMGRALGDQDAKTRKPGEPTQMDDEFDPSTGEVIPTEEEIERLRREEEDTPF